VKPCPKSKTGASGHHGGDERFLACHADPRVAAESASVKYIITQIRTVVGECQGSGSAIRNYFSRVRDFGLRESLIRRNEARF
jgi:hypothetical protein